MTIINHSVLPAEVIKSKLILVVSTVNKSFLMSVLLPVLNLNAAGCRYDVIFFSISKIAFVKSYNIEMKLADANSQCASD